jgi:hypothetical protein
LRRSLDKRLQLALRLPGNCFCAEVTLNSAAGLTTSGWPSCRPFLTRSRHADRLAAETESSGGEKRNHAEPSRK